MWIIQIAIITFSIVALMVFVSRPMYYITQACKALGFGFLVYHSDSQKYFYCITRKDALEWLGATYADAVMFSNWSKDVQAIKFNGKTRAYNPEIASKELANI